MFDLPTLQQTQQQLPLYHHQLPPTTEHAQEEAAALQRQLSSPFGFDLDSGGYEYEYDYQYRDFQDPLVPPPPSLQQPDLAQYMTLEMNGMQLQVPRADASFLYVPSAAPAIVGHERDGGGCISDQSAGVSGGGMGNVNDNNNVNANVDTGVVGWSFDTFMNMVPPPAQPVASASSSTAASAPMMTMTMSATNDAGQLQFPSTEYIQPVDVDYRQQQSRLAQQAQRRQVQKQAMAQYGPQMRRQMAVSGSHGRGQGLGPMQMELQASPAQAQGQSQSQQVWSMEGGGAAAKDAAQG